MTPPVSPDGLLQRMVERNELSRLSGPDHETARQMVDDSEAHLRSVEAVMGVSDYTGAQMLAYEVGRKAALALLLANGLRPAGGDEHRKSFAGAEHCVSGAARQALREAGALRTARHAGMYRAQTTSEQDAAEAWAITQEIVRLVLPAVRARLA